MQADKLYPYRQKELLKVLAQRLEGRITVTSADLQIARRLYAVDDDPNLSYQAQHSPRKYTDAFVDWLLDRFAADPTFFQKNREAARARVSEPAT
jgi:hypothetical protein